MNKMIKAGLMLSSISAILAVGHYFMFSEKERKDIKDKIKNIIGKDDIICN